MVAVVTGGSRGIGLGIAEELLKKDFMVIVTARNKSAEVELLEKGLQEEALAPDTVYPESLQEMIDEYEESQKIKEKLEDEIYS